MQSLRGQILRMLEAWVSLGSGCGLWALPCWAVVLIALFPEADAMPTHLSYEELVRKNVVSEGKRAGGWAWGQPTEAGACCSLGNVHHVFPEVRPGDGAEPAHP